MQEARQLLGITSPALALQSKLLLRTLETQDDNSHNPFCPVQTQESEDRDKELATPGNRSLPPSQDPVQTREAGSLQTDSDSGLLFCCPFALLLNHLASGYSSWQCLGAGGVAEIKNIHLLTFTCEIQSSGTQGSCLVRRNWQSLGKWI